MKIKEKTMTMKLLLNIPEKIGIYYGNAETLFFCSGNVTVGGRDEIVDGKQQDKSQTVERTAEARYSKGSYRTKR